MTQKNDIYVCFLDESRVGICRFCSVIIKYVVCFDFCFFPEFSLINHYYEYAVFVFCVSFDFIFMVMFVPYFNCFIVLYFFRGQIWGKLGKLPFLRVFVWQFIWLLFFLLFLTILLQKLLDNYVIEENCMPVCYLYLFEIKRFFCFQRFLFSLSLSLSCACVCVCVWKGKEELFPI